MSWANSIDNIFKTRNSYNIQPLKEAENYKMWSIRIRALLAGSDLVSYITIQNYDIEPVIEGQPSVLLFKKAEKVLKRLQGMVNKLRMMVIYSQ